MTETIMSRIRRQIIHTICSLYQTIVSLYAFSLGCGIGGSACVPLHALLDLGIIISSSFQVVYVHLLICNAPLASNLSAQSGLSMKISSNVYENVTVSSALCICISKVTAPQDAHGRLVLQVYLGSNTSEFIGRLYVGKTFVSRP